MLDRLGLAMLALGTLGVGLLAWPSAQRIRPAPQVNAIPVPYCSADGGTAEMMQGPLRSLEDVCGSCDAEVADGIAPFHQVTVLRVGDGAADLTNHDRLLLVVRSDVGWFTRELASVGPFCGGMGSPTWVDAEANAPRIIDGVLSVRVHETFRQGDSERTADTLVECRIAP